MTDVVLNYRSSAPIQPPVTLSIDEARELYRYTLNDYINPNNFPALVRLLDRVGLMVKQADAAPADCPVPGCDGKGRVHPSETVSRQEAPPRSGYGPLLIRGSL